MKGANKRISRTKTRFLICVSSVAEKVLGFGHGSNTDGTRTRQQSGERLLGGISFVCLVPLHESTEPPTKIGLGESTFATNNSCHKNKTFNVCRAKCLKSLSGTLTITPPFQLHSWHE